MDQGFANGQTSLLTKVNGWIINFMDEVSINGKVEIDILGSGHVVSCMVWVLIYIMMDEFIKDNFKMTKDMVMVYLRGRMVKCMMEVGKMD